ncbi:MAG: TniQ family protein [Cellvibrionaceae bacterium]|nr:TniQ family protein [Cellvibrionaceae bacterium]
MKLIKPPIFPKCFEDESPVGYLLRLAELNLYGSYRWLITDQRKPAISLTELYELLCQNPWTGFSKSHVFNQLNGLTYRYLQTPKIKACMECVRESNYWDIHIHAVLSPVCPKHRCWRTDICPTCQKSYSWHRGDLKRCSCKAERGADTDLPSQFAVELSAFIEDQNREGISGRLDPNEFTYKSRCDLLLMFSLYCENKGKAGDFPRFTTVEEIKECWEKVGNLLFGDLKDFYSFLRDLHIRDSVGFKSFYRSLQEFDQICLSEHREVLINFITRDLKTSITKQHRSLYGDKPVNDIWVPLQAVSRQYEVPKSTLQQLMEEGKLKHQTKVFERRAQTLIYIESPQKFQDFINQYVNYKVALELLGVTKAQLKLIIDNSFIEDICKPDDNHFKWLISKADIESLKERLHKNYEHRDCDSLKVSEALSFYSTGFQELLPPLLKALLAGQITVVAKTEELHLRDITMDKEEFIEWRNQKIKASDKMSIPDLADRFRINQESMYQIVNSGLIEAEDYGKNRLNRLISESEIQKFKQKYALLSRIADVRKRNPLEYKAIIESYRIEPVKGLNGEKLRQTIYRREDLSMCPTVAYLVEGYGDWWYDRNYPEAA